MELLIEKWKIVDGKVNKTSLYVKRVKWILISESTYDKVERKFTKVCKSWLSVK